jgi:hypothetical protein
MTISNFIKKIIVVWSNERLDESDYSTAGLQVPGVDGGWEESLVDDITQKKGRFMKKRKNYFYLIILGRLNLRTC